MHLLTADRPPTPAIHPRRTHSTPRKLLASTRVDPKQFRSPQAEQPALPRRQQWTLRQNPIGPKMSWSASVSDRASRRHGMYRRWLSLGWIASIRLRRTAHTAPANVSAHPARPRQTKRNRFQSPAIIHTRSYRCRGRARRLATNDFAARPLVKRFALQRGQRSGSAIRPRPRIDARPQSRPAMGRPGPSLIHRPLGKPTLLANAAPPPTRSRSASRRRRRRRHQPPTIRRTTSSLGPRRPQPPALHLSSAVGLWEGPSQLRQRIAILLDEQLTVLRNCSRRWRIAAGCFRSWRRNSYCRW